MGLAGATADAQMLHSCLLRLCMPGQSRDSELRAWNTYMAQLSPNDAPEPLLPLQAWAGFGNALLAAWRPSVPHQPPNAKSEPAVRLQAWAEQWGALLAAWGPPLPHPPPGGPTQASGTAAHLLDLHCRRVIGGAAAALPDAAAKCRASCLLNAHRKALLDR